MYRRMGETWRRLWREGRRDLWQKAIKWRREPAIHRIEKPARLDKARRLGYRAKQGMVVVRVRVGRGGMRRKRPRAGRRPKHLGVVRIKAATSMKEVAIRRAAERFPNLLPLGSYTLYSNGKHLFYEVLMVDPHHPAIKYDRELRHKLKLLA